MPSTPEDRLFGITTSVAVKPAAAISADTNITLFGEQTITTTTITGTNTVKTVSGMRVLLMGQDNAVDNGIWIAGPATWRRAADFDGARDAINGTLVSTVFGDQWLVRGGDDAGEIRIGYDDITFEYRDVPDVTFRTALASSDDGQGDGLVGVKQPYAGAVARTQHDKNKERLSVLDFEAVADFDSSLLEGTDNTTAFRNAIAAAITAGCKEVYIPAGNYLITGELNLGGVGYAGINGVRLVGEGYFKSLIWFKAASSNAVCISSIGGSGSNTSQALAQVGVRAHPSTVGMGIGMQLNGPNFFDCFGFQFRELNIGIHLYNGNSGSFTEFNRLMNGRLLYNNINIKFEVGNGNNSFHANTFFNIQNQVKTSGGIGVQVVGLNTKSAYMYNQTWNMNFFGGTGCIAFDLQYCNTDWVGGYLTGESALIFQSDANSVWEFHGPFYSIGTITYNVPTEIAQLFGRFVFTNTTSKSGSAFSATAMSSYNAYPYIQELADRSNNGTFPAIFRVQASNIDTLGFASYNFAGNDFFFGQVASGTSFKDFIYRFKLLRAGEGVTTTSASYAINLPSNGLNITATSISPLLDNVSSFGLPTARGTTVYATNSTISVSNKIKKTNIRQIIDSEVNAFYAISKLDSVWQWLEKYQVEGDAARLHSGPTVQDAMDVMTANGLDWSAYSAFCYDEWEAQEEIIETWDDQFDEEGNITVYAGSEVKQKARDAGYEYSFRKEELLLWITRAHTARMDSVLERLEALESK